MSISIRPMAAQGENYGASALVQQAQSVAYEHQYLPIIDPNVPGNRLYSPDGKTILLAPEKTPAYVAGEIIANAVQGVGRSLNRARISLGALPQKVTSLARRVIPFQRWFSGGFKTASAATCFSTIQGNHPNMNEAAGSVVQALCNDNTEDVTFTSIQLNSEGGQGVSEALAQTTAVKSFQLINVYCDTAAFATAMLTPLQTINLETATLKLRDLATSPYTPSPMSATATETLLKNLAYFRASKIGLGFVDFTTGVAQAFADTLLANPFFPLQSFAMTWHGSPDGLPYDSQLNLICEGLAANNCLYEIGLGEGIGISSDNVISLLQAFRGQTVKLWCPGSFTFNATQKEAILAAVQANLHFLNVTNIAPIGTCFEPDFAEAIANITANRTAFVRDPLCDVPLNHSVNGTVAASTSVTQSAGFQAGMTVGGLALVGAIAALNYTAKKKEILWHRKRSQDSLSAKQVKQVKAIARTEVRDVAILLANLQPGAGGSGRAGLPELAVVPSAGNQENPQEPGDAGGVVRSVHFQTPPQREGESSIAEHSVSGATV